jgi:hypothetical protein
VPGGKRKVLVREVPAREIAQDQRGQTKIRLNPPGQKMKVRTFQLLKVL